MLRFLFDEPRRGDTVETAAFRRAVETFQEAVKHRAARVRVDEAKLVRLELWCRGLIDALNELEQSLYCASRYVERVGKSYVESMTESEHDDYRRFVYFYKNGLIRLFSILDKLGYFLDDLLELRTNKIKSKFSFFTVLRNMRQNGLHKRLEEQLTELKNEHRERLDKLRNQRNMEIHFINAEMLDELSDNNRRGGDRLKVEDVRMNADDLAKAYDMVALTLQISFAYLSRK